MVLSKIGVSSIIFFSAIHMYVCLNEYIWREPEAYENIIIFNKITSNRNPGHEVLYRGNVLSDLFNLVWTSFITLFYLLIKLTNTYRWVIQGEQLIPWMLEPIMLWSMRNAAMHTKLLISYTYKSKTTCHGQLVISNMTRFTLNGNLKDPH